MSCCSAFNSSVVSSLLVGCTVAALLAAACSSNRAPDGPVAGSNTTSAGGASAAGSLGGGMAVVDAAGVGGAATAATTGQGGSSVAVPSGGTPGIGGASDVSTNVDAGGSGVVSGEFVGNVEVTVHENVNTILVVTWTQLEAADQVWLEFSFETGNVMTSPPRPGTTGEHREKVLGIPGETDVTIRVVSSAGGMNYATPDQAGRTDAVPSGMPTPAVDMFDAERASEDRWMLGSVEDSPPPAGSGRPNYYTGQFWLYIIDRQGRIVWYYSDPSNNASSSFQRPARDGQYLWVDQGRSGNQGVVKVTLDQEYFETIDVPVGDAIDVTNDGSLLYDVNGTLHEYDATGQDRTIWSCSAELSLQPNCYSNAVNYNALDDTVLLSFPEPGAVVEIERATGNLVGYYGNQQGAWDFAAPLTTPPSEWRFGVQHFPNITADGTLIVSSHLPPHETFTQEPYPGEHAFIEFSLDRSEKTLTELWRYTEGQEWPHAKGMAIKLANGNVLANYGTGGVIREITPDKQTVFYVKFDLESADDAYNMMVGHNELINDLYALNDGPE